MTSSRGRRLAEPAVAVIGSAGFLGTALTAALRRRGVEPVAFTRDTPFLDESGRPRAGLLHARTVYYLASTITPPLAEREPWRVAADRDTFERLLESLPIAPGETSGPVTVVIPGSGGTVYDPAFPPPYAESAPVRPVTAYGRARLEMERMLLAAGDRCRPVVARISNVYGPGQRVGTGQGVVAHWLDAVARGSAISVFGDADATRDYVYIDDVATALAQVDARHSELPAVVNVGSGQPTSLRELAEVVKAAVDLRELEVHYEQARTFDRTGTWLDVSLAAAALNWKAQTPLLDGIRESWSALRSLPA